jgi:hypothetical protein
MKIKQYAEELARQVDELEAENERLLLALIRIADFPGNIVDAGWDMHGIATAALEQSLRNEEGNTDEKCAT